MVFVKEFFKKIDFEKSAEGKKACKIHPVCKELNIVIYHNCLSMHLQTLVYIVDN